MFRAATAALVFVPQLRNVITPQGPPEISHSKLLFPLHAWAPQLFVFFTGVLGELIFPISIFVFFSVVSFLPPATTTRLLGGVPLRSSETESSPLP